MSEQYEAIFDRYIKAAKKLALGKKQAIKQEDNPHAKENILLSFFRETVCSIKEHVGEDLFEKVVAII
mgnify:CR=1 FL=1